MKSKLQLIVTFCLLAGSTAVTGTDDETVMIGDPVIKETIVAD